MKKLVLYAVLCMILVGCGTTSQQRVNLTSYNEGQRQAYEEWLAIDIDSLTSVQMRALDRFEGELTDFDLDIISEYPWINPRNLSVRDKLFLVDVGTALIGAFAS